MPTGANYSIIAAMRSNALQAASGSPVQWKNTGLKTAPRSSWELALKVLLVMTLVLTLPLPGQALQVTGLYSFRIAVANESQAERSRAFRDALAAVVIKVTGSPRWLENPAVTRALANAQNLVEAFTYSTELIPAPAPVTTTPAAAASSPITAPATSPTGQPATPAIQPATVPATAPATREQRYVNVTFAASLINEMLISANVPIWDSNRPSVLVWMVLQEANGERRLLTADGDPEVMNLIKRFGTERGLPVIFPVLDFEDRRSLPVESLWNLEEDVIVAASTRYQADTILSGRLLFAANGELVGLWQFIFQNQATIFDGLESDLQAYLHQPLDRITTQLADYFAVVPVNTNQTYVRLRVEGIDDLSAYTSLLTYVNTLGLVRSVVTASLDGPLLELELGLQGDPQQLLELIALDRDLRPIANAQGPDASVLHYRWTR